MGMNNWIHLAVLPINWHGVGGVTHWFQPIDICKVSGHVLPTQRSKEYFTSLLSDSAIDVWCPEFGRKDLGQRTGIT